MNLELLCSECHVDVKPVALVESLVAPVGSHVAPLDVPGESHVVPVGSHVAPVGSPVESLVESLVGNQGSLREGNQENK